MAINFERLRAPFPAEDIEWRVGQSGKGQKGFFAKVLAYLTNRAIMERLDEVCGPGNWWNEFRPAPHDPSGKSVLCGITILVDDRPVTKWDGAESTDIESTKGGLSDAMKRSAVQWGIGRYLYDLGESWAECSEERRDGWNFAKTKEGGKFYWRAPGLPQWALPSVTDKPLTEIETRVLRASLPPEKTPHEIANAATGNRLKRGSDLPQPSPKSEPKNLAGATEPVKQVQRGDSGNWKQWLTPPQEVAESNGHVWYIQAWKGLRAHGGAKSKHQVEALLWYLGLEGVTPEQVVADHHIAETAWKKLVEAHASGHMITGIVGEAIQRYEGETVKAQ